MEKLQDKARKGYHGKLTDVLGHLLRVGDQTVSENIVKAYKERGLTPPGHIETPPTIQPEHQLYWTAWQDLQTERVNRAHIPVNAIIQYCQAYMLDFDMIKRIVWEIDRVMFTHWKNVDEAEKVRREAAVNQQKSLTMKPGG